KRVARKLSRELASLDDARTVEVAGAKQRALLAAPILVRPRDGSRTAGHAAGLNRRSTEPATARATQANEALEWDADVLTNVDSDWIPPLESWKPARPGEMLDPAGRVCYGAGVSCVWISRCQLNGPQDVGVAVLVDDELGSIHSFSHSIG